MNMTCLENVLNHLISMLQVPNNMFFQKVLKRRHGASHVSLAQQLNRTSPARA